MKRSINTLLPPRACPKIPSCSQKRKVYEYFSKDNMKATTLINRYDTKAYKLFSLLHEFDKLLSLELPTQKHALQPENLD